MAIELNFFKPDSAISWGFRLVGGADFNEPLVVVKVNENSLAEKAGLAVGDVVVRINNTPTAGITHAVAHDLINEAGCDFVAAVRRGLFSDIPFPAQEENNNEIEDILENSIAERLADIQKYQEFGSTPEKLENLAGQEQLILTTESTKVNESPKKPKKFSSFLVKPKNAKPVSKQEERKIIGEPYRVKIIKQPRRDPNEVLNKKSVKFDSYVTEVEISREASFADSTDSLEISEFRGDAEMEVETSVHINEETTVEIYDGDEDNDQDKGSDTTDTHTLENEIIQKEDELIIRKSKPIVKPTPLDIHIDPVVCESSLPLEEQLAAVQKQLLALSQLPTAIQVTLEAVTAQLNKIVFEKMRTAEDSEYHQNQESQNDNENIDGLEEIIEEETLNENLSTSENAEGDITENEMEDNQNLDELEEDHDFDDHHNANIDEEDFSELTDKNDYVEADPYAGLTEEEREEKIREEELLAKKQKIAEERQRERQKMDWTQRPIVLPGGRKWIDPDDATPKLSTPKMSDEKISKTLDDFSEVLVGKTKGSTTGTEYGLGGTKKNQSTVPENQTASWCPARLSTKFINFLKYQPPPKNLDYLQKSEVYRLIHGMEAPVRGVEARAEKILSENDYCEIKGAP